MNLFGFTISRQQPTPPVQRSVPNYLIWGDLFDSNHKPSLLNAYEQVVWVYRAINVLAEQVANMPFRFSHGPTGAEDIITSGPLYDFYERPHPLLNGFQYWELRVIWLMLRGECFRLPVRDERGRLNRILILDPERFEHIVRDHELVGWRYRDSRPDSPAQSQVLLPEEVWHDKLANPFNFWRGLPPLALATVAAQTDYAASLHMKGIIENNGEGNLVIQTEQPLDAEQREQLVAQCLERKRRVGRADIPLVLPNGAEVVPPTLSSADAQFIATRRYSCSEICAAFGVPEEIITSTDTTKYDVMAGTRLNFIENRVVPLCRRLAAEEQRTVRLIDPRATGWFDVDEHPILAEARRNRLAAARAGFEMGVPFNELNRAFDLGFQKLPWGNTGYIPNKLTAAGTLGGTNPKSE